MTVPNKSSFTKVFDVAGVPDGDSVASAVLSCKSAAQFSADDGSSTWSVSATVVDNGSGANDPERVGTATLSFAIGPTQTTSNVIGTEYTLSLAVTLTSGGLYYPLDAQESFVVVVG